MIGFSERDAAHNHDLLRCLFSQRCMRSWRSHGRPLLRPEAARLPPLSSLPLMAGPPGGMWTFPRWRERLRCSCVPQNATTWRCCPRLLSKAFKLTAALAAKAYSAAGQATSAMHAMVILQVHQAKALKQMHEGSTDHFRIAYTPKSWNGHDAVVQFAWPSRNALPLIQRLGGPCLSIGRSALKTSALACRLSRWMPLMRSGALHATGMQPLGSGQGFDCFGTSTVLSFWQCY